MAHANRVWLGFLLAPAIPALLLYFVTRLKGYGDEAVLAPILLIMPAYASALFLGLPAHVLLGKRRVKGFGAYIGVGIAIGIAAVAAITLMQAVQGWNWTPDHAYSLSLWKYSVGYFRVAALYAAVASAAFWLIAIWERQPPKPP